MSATSFQLNRDLATVLGFKPARFGEKVVRYQLHANTVTVLFSKELVAKKGRKEIREASQLVRVYTQEGGLWSVSDCAATPVRVTDCTDFSAPTARERADRAAWTRLSGAHREELRMHYA